MAIIAGTAVGGRTVVASGTKRGHRLCVWELETGAVGHMTLGVAFACCLVVAGSGLIVGRNRAVFGLPLAGQ